ncbi:hypothetical protein N2152v2_009034 [Parachlorella kessleri]
MDMSDWLTRFVPGVLLGIALKWLADQQQVGKADDDGKASASSFRGVEHTPAPREELKMVLVVNDELRMGKGKIGAQCAHAAVGLVEKLTHSRDTAARLVLRQWETCGQAKRALAAAAREAGLPTYLVQDAGRTQVAAGSRTVLAIGPAARSQIDRITGHLKLL